MLLSASLVILISTHYAHPHCSDYYESFRNIVESLVGPIDNLPSEAGLAIVSCLRAGDETSLIIETIFSKISRKLIARTSHPLTLLRTCISKLAAGCTKISIKSHAETDSLLFSLAKSAAAPAIRKLSVSDGLTDASGSCWSCFQSLESVQVESLALTQSLLRLPSLRKLRVIILNEPHSLRSKNPDAIVVKYPPIFGSGSTLYWLRSIATCRPDLGFLSISSPSRSISSDSYAKVVEYLKGNTNLCKSLERLLIGTDVTQNIKIAEILRDAKASSSFPVSQAITRLTWHDYATVKSLLPTDSDPSETATQARLDQINERFPTLKALSISRCDWEARDLSQFANLKELAIQSPVLDGTFSAWPPKLEVLVLSIDIIGCTTEQFANSLCRATSLTDLRLVSCLEFSPSLIGRLLKSLTKLQSLNIEGPAPDPYPEMALSHPSMRIFPALASQICSTPGFMPNLTSYAMSQSSDDIANQGVPLEKLCLLFPHLEDLKIEAHRALEFSSLRRLKFLRAITFTAPDPPEEFAVELSIFLPQIRELSISKCCPSPSFFNSLVRNCPMTSVVYLDLRNCSVGMPLLDMDWLKFPLLRTLIICILELPHSTQHFAPITFHGSKYPFLCDVHFLLADGKVLRRLTFDSLPNLQQVHIGIRGQVDEDDDDDETAHPVAGTAFRFEGCPLLSRIALGGVQISSLVAKSLPELKVLAAVECPFVPSQEFPTPAAAVILQDLSPYMRTEATPARVRPHEYGEGDEAFCQILWDASSD